MKKLKVILMSFVFLFTLLPRVAVYAADDKSAEVVISAPRGGYYNIVIDYLSAEGVRNPEFNLLINGELQDIRHERIIAPVYWNYESFEFFMGRHGNELLPMPMPMKNFRERTLIHRDDLRNLEFYLDAGENTLTFETVVGEIEIKEAWAVEIEQLPSYAEIQRNSNENITQNELITIEGHHPLEMNSSNLRLSAVRNPDVSPYDSSRALLNTVSETWELNGDEITYGFNVEEAGLYNISLNVMQNLVGEMVFRDILIDGEIPFEQMRAYPIPYSRRFRNHTLGNEEGVYSFFFEVGYHEITLRATAYPHLETITKLTQIRDEIRDVALMIRQLTGNQVDQNRQWRIEEYIPDINEQFARWINTLEEELVLVREIHTLSAQSAPEVELNQIIRRLSGLTRNINELPFRMSELSEGSASVAILLANLEESLSLTPLALNQIYIHSSDVTLPKPASLFARVMSNVAQFFASFGNHGVELNETDENTLEIWVGRSQQHVELMQHMADTVFTPQTGIRVNFSLMPDDRNLILANSGGLAPDAAVGIAMHLPFQMAIRGAAADLSQFDNIGEVMSRFSPGAFMPLMYEGGVYGLPETQDFYVTFYREDILNTFGVPVPDTWEEVIGILPALNRFGANYFIPLSGPSAHKPFMFTSPFFYQFGADFYSESGLTTAINSAEAIEALRLMTDLYTLYSLPMQVANFFNDFRYGAIPIGVSNLETYVQLLSAAPEIAGQWNIAPHPGIKQDDGEVSRYAAGSAQVSMILESSDKKQQAYDFISWWLSFETQRDYIRSLTLIFGPTFLWSSANLEAFATLPIPQEHIEVILNQWEYLKEVPLMPASYIIEREVSNVWNSVVFEGESLRVATDRSVIIIDREISRRMEEFGYMSNGVIERYFELPTLEKIRGMMYDNKN